MMIQKLVIGLLALTLIGAAGVGMYDATRQSPDEETPDVLANPVSAQDAAAVGDAQPAAADALAQTVTATPTAPAVPQSGDGTGPVELQQQQNQSLSMVGEPWSASGTIALLDAVGFTLALDDGSEIYVELGPSSYWGAQGVTLAAGDRVTVEGFYNGQQAHAGTVTKADGSQLAVRTAEGQPLWSGGAAGGGATAGAGQAVEVPAEDWVTIDGTVTSLVNSTLNVQTGAGETLAIQLGEPGFWQAQGVTFAPGDAVAVLGFWQGTQFQVGEVTKTATGERLMLRDPNGRSLWAGPGRNGNTNGAAAGGQGAQGQGNQAAGGAQGGQGQGGQGQWQGVLVPAAQWETLRGSVTMVEPLALTLQTQAGETVRVMLGQVDFWSEQGIWFSVRDALAVQGYWLNGQFEAGVVTFDASGQQVTIRDQNGRLLWMNTQGAQGQGNQGQGNQAAGAAQGGGQGNQAAGTATDAQGTQGRQFRGGRQ